jgi:hypothetical protein
MAERLELAQRFIATVRDQPEGSRARLLAAGSEILSQLSDMQETTEANFAGVMYTRLTTPARVAASAPASPVIRDADDLLPYEE